MGQSNGMASDDMQADDTAAPEKLAGDVSASGAAPVRTPPLGGASADGVSAPPWGALWVLALGLAMIVLDGSIVNVSIPAIIADIKISLTDAQWVTSLYSIVLAALLLPLGKLGDAKGRKTVFQTGVAVFVVSSLLAAGSRNAAMMLSARTLQGIGAAMIMPATLSTMSASFRGKYRAAAFGVWGAVMSAAAAIGPLLGGWFTQTIGWRWIFIVNLPVGVVVFLAAIPLVPQTGGPRPDAGATMPGSVERGIGADPWGMLLSAVSSGLLIFSLIEGETYGWWRQSSAFFLGSWTWNRTWPVSPVPLCLVVAVVCFALFVVLERARARRGRPVMLDLSLFSIRTFAWGNLAAGAISAGEFAIIFVLPLYLINARGMDTMQAGGILAAMAAGAIVSGGLARHVSRLLTAAGTVQLGLVCEIAGVAATVALMGDGYSAVSLLVALAVYGFGLGLASAQLTSVVLSQVPVAQSGEGSATQSTIRQLGTAMGAAISGTSLAITLNAVLPARLSAISGLPSRVASGLATAVSSTAGNIIPTIRAQGTTGKLGPLGPHVADAMTSGFVEGGRWAMAIAGSMLIIGLLASIMVRRANDRAIEGGRADR